ncbi:MAG TPA: response regulator [Nitrospiraceae bacterium]|jgi:CheY-like chemotaxis protein
MKKKTILIIDDHADTRLLVSARLKKHQYNTVFAADGMQAIAVARETKPDAILLDLSLPGGNGFIVLTRLKTNTALSGIPVIILTADESPESELKGLEAGAEAFLHKPVQEEALIVAVESAVGSVTESPIANARLEF